MELSIYNFENTDINQTYFYVSDHKLDIIMVDSGKFKQLVSCDRCGGSGKLPQFGYIADGTCFACNGSGKKLASLKYFKTYKAAERYLQKLAYEQNNSIEIAKQEILKKFGKKFYCLLSNKENNTYTYKEEIKTNGGKWSSILECWCSPIINDKFYNLEMITEEYFIIKDNTFKFDYSTIKSQINNLYSTIFDLDNKIASCTKNNKDTTSLLVLKHQLFEKLHYNYKEGE